MKKIDKSLKNAYILCDKAKKEMCLVYYISEQKTQQYLNKHNIQIVQKFEFINAFVVFLEYDIAQKLACQKFVEHLSFVANVYTQIDKSKKIMGIQNLPQSNANITVALIDTGINPHLDFVIPQNRIIKFVDLINKEQAPYDDNGHGTFVAGVLAGNGLVSNGKYSGIAKTSNIVAIKALNSKGEANAVQILEAMQWIYQNHQNYNIKVVCMSFGSEPLGQTDPIMRGAEKLWRNGIVVVAAAGNSGPNFQTIKSPGISSKIITVGGFDANNGDNVYNKDFFTVAEFSSRGPALGRYKPDCVAPSVHITSCDFKKFYTQLSGTSVATPMIAGICANLIANNPEYTPEQTKKIVLKKCKSIIKGGQNKHNIEGFGYPCFE